MKLELCPRCELNYITANERYCKVCLQEMNGGIAKEEVEMCSICNEMPALPGKDVCSICLREMNSSAAVDDDNTDLGDAAPQNPDDYSEMDSVSQMDEIIPDVEEEKDFEGLGEHLSLESVREDEEKQQDEQQDLEESESDD